MSGATVDAVRAIREAWADGIIGERRGPGRTVTEICQAAGIENPEVVLGALNRLQARGEVDGGLWMDAFGEKTLLFWRRADVLPGPDAPWLQPRAADRARRATNAAPGATGAPPAATPAGAGEQLCLAL